MKYVSQHSWWCYIWRHCIPCTCDISNGNYFLLAIVITDGISPVSTIFYTLFNNCISIYRDFTCFQRSLLQLGCIWNRLKSHVSKGSQFFSVCPYWFNPFPHIFAFWSLCSRRLIENIETIKKKMLKTSNFSFWHNVFHF